MKKMITLGILVLLAAVGTAWAASMLASADVTCNVNGTQKMVRTGYECKDMGGMVVLPSIKR